MLGKGNKITQINIIQFLKNRIHSSNHMILYGTSKASLVVIESGDIQDCL